MESVFSMLPGKADRPQIGRAGLFLLCCLCASTGSAWEIRGAVKDDVGNPIAAVPVSGYGRGDNTNGFASAITGQDGAFSLQAFDARWQVSVDAGALSAHGRRSVPSPE